MEVAALGDDDPVLSELRAVLQAAETEPDPTGGALYYYALSMTSPPSWADDPRHPLARAGRFGNQIFFREARAPG